MPTFTDSPPGRSSRFVDRPEAAAGRADVFARFLAEFRDRLDRKLARWLEERRREASAESSEWAELVAEVARLVDGGGKRLRPALVDAGYRACGGRSEEAVLRLSMAVELLHTYLLVHDDIMDHADVRRGNSTTHVVFAERHAKRSWPGDAADYGRSVAILVGDLAHTLAAELSRPLPEAEGDPADVARCFDTMSSEVIGGQFLEMTLPFRAGADSSSPPDEAELLRALRLKSGRYSVERPLELGARLAGAGPELLDGLRRYGEAVGDAFQLQDDVLGTFGEATAVGKPVASDLEEGKYTFLIHHTLAGAAPDDRSWLRDALGRGPLEAEEVERARGVIRRSGGLDAVVQMIEERLSRAVRHTLEDLPFPGDADRHRDLFLGLVAYLARRDR